LQMWCHSPGSSSSPTSILTHNSHNRQLGNVYEGNNNGWQMGTFSFATQTS
jgi:hypothetical protein